MRCLIAQKHVHAHSYIVIYLFILKPFAKCWGAVKPVDELYDALFFISSNL